VVDGRFMVVCPVVSGGDVDRDAGACCRVRCEDDDLSTSMSMFTVFLTMSGVWRYQRIVLIV
jgi:hypothetical protein